VTKKVALVDHGAREGLDCLVCHREATGSARTDNVSPVRPPLSIARHRFDRSIPASASCATCHSETQKEWDTWQAGPRPRVANWPPGTIEWSAQPPASSCVDCHMRRLATPLDKTLSHSFNTRRNPQFLGDGLLARIEPATTDRPPRVVLTNLAGHSYPTGTHRRSIRVEVQYDDNPATRILLSRLKRKSSVPTTHPFADVLAPGEERSIDLPARPHATRLTCDVTYERNGFVDTGFEVILAHLTQQLRR
jgi:hypothetical protein